MLRVSLISLVLPFSVDAARIGRQNTSSYGGVTELFTFGAPHVSHPAATRGDGGCFNGYRFTNGQRTGWYDGDEDIVPTIFTFSKYNMPDIKSIMLADTGNPVKDNWECGDDPFKVNRRRVKLHDMGLYLSNMEKLPDTYANAKVAAKVGLKSSYTSNLDEVRQNAQDHGWNLVGSALAGEEDVSHLVQHPNSLKCILSFEGSVSFRDWVANAVAIRTDFCGLTQGFHLGFRNELRRMVTSSAFKSNVHSKLSKCSSVTVVGHSLGGAVATLFAACVDAQNGSDDFQSMSWIKDSNPSLISSM